MKSTRFSVFTWVSCRCRYEISTWYIIRVSTGEIGPKPGLECQWQRQLISHLHIIYIGQLWDTALADLLVSFIPFLEHKFVKFKMCCNPSYQCYEIHVLLSLSPRPWIGMPLPPVKYIKAVGEVGIFMASLSYWNNTASEIYSAIRKKEPFSGDGGAGIVSAARQQFLPSWMPANQLLGTHSKSTKHLELVSSLQ